MSRCRRADTDFDLVSDLQRGDLAAFSEIVVRYQQVVCAVAFSACGRQALSEDVAQETFVAAWKNIAKLEDSGKLKAWLCSIARNRARDVLRKRRREVLTEDGEGRSSAFQSRISDAPSPLQRAVTVEEEGQLWEALQEIPQGYRETLVLYYRDGQSIHQVAEGLDLSIAAVKQRLSRGRAALRDSLGRVSHGLARTQPSKAFTVGVIAAVAARSGVAAAASVASAGLARTQSGVGVSKGGLYSLGVSCMAVLILGLSGLLVWTLVELAPGKDSQFETQPAGLPKVVKNSRAHSTFVPATATSDKAVQQFRIDGKVVDLFQQGVAGATVALGGDSQRTVTTEQDGSFTFLDVERGAVAIQARTMDSGSRPVSLHIDDETERVILELLEGSTLELLLQDGRGGPPLSGIAVELESDSIVLNATTDKQGRAVFRGITTPMNFATVEAPGFATSLLPILLSAEPGIHKRSLPLVRGHALSGAVRDEEGQGIAGAKIIVHSDESTPREDSTVSDDEGKWRFPTVSPEYSMLIATHDDYAWATLPVDLKGAKGEVTRDMVLSRGRSAEGRVVYADGSPAAFATVRSQPFGKPVTTDKDGVFRIHGLEPGDFGLYAKHKIYGSETASLQAVGATRNMRLVLEDHSVRGVVLDGSGRRLAGAQVRLTSSEHEMLATRQPMVQATTLSNSRGEFSLGPLPANGTFDLVAVMPRVSPAYLALDPLDALQVRSGQRDVQMTLEKSGKIVGKVVGPGGKGIDEFALVIANYTEALHAEASSPFTASGGEFALTDVPRGRYAIALVAEGFEPKLIEDVGVRADGTADLGLVRLKRGASLRGRVVDARGRALAGAHVVAGSQIVANHSRFRMIMPSPAEGADPFKFTSSSEMEVFTDSMGYFEFKNMHSRRGRFFVAAELAGVGRSELVEIRKQGKTEMRLTLHAAGGVRGMIRGAGNDAVVSALRRDDDLRETNALYISAVATNHSFSIEQLTPGPYVLSAHSMNGPPDFATGVPVQVEAGKVMRVELELSTRKLPPWDSAALEAYARHIDAYCDCRSNSCRSAEDGELKAIDDAHKDLTGPDFQTLTILDEKRIACER